MFEDEKNVLVSWGFILGCIVIIVSSIFVSNKVNPIYLVLVLLGILYIWLTPSFVKKYYIVHGAGDDIDFTRFIPFWNELCIFSPTLTIPYCIALFGVIVSGCATFINPSILAKFISNTSTISSWADKCIIACILFIVAFCIIRGIGFGGVFRNINIADNKLAGFKGDGGVYGVFKVIQYIILFIPLCRVFSLLTEYNRLCKLEKFTKLTLEDIDKLSEGQLSNDFESFYVDSNKATRGKKKR